MAENKPNDDFADFESTLQKIEDILNNKDTLEDDGTTQPKAKTAEDFENLDVDKVHLTVRENRTVINKKLPSHSMAPKSPSRSKLVMPAKRNG